MCCEDCSRIIWSCKMKFKHLFVNIKFLLVAFSVAASNAALSVEVVDKRNILPEMHLVGNSFLNNGVLNLNTNNKAYDTPPNAGAFSVLGDDGGFTFTNALSLPDNVRFFSFTASLSSFSAAAGTEPGTSKFADTFSVAIYDSVSQAHDKIFADSVDFNLSTSLISFSLDISAFQGREFALSFELFDENNGFDSQVIVSSACFASSSGACVSEVPLPITGFWGMLVALLGLVSGRNKYLNK